MDVGICTAQRDGDPKSSFHNRWRFSQTWNKLQITERTLLMWDLNPYKTHSMQQHDTLRSLLNITEFFFHQVIKDTWVRDTLLATDCPRQPRHNKAKATAQVATANTLFKATTSWSWTQLAPGLWGRCLFKLRFCDEAKMPATHTRPKWWKVTLKRTNWPFPAAHLKGAFASGRRPGIRPSFVFLPVRFGNIAQDESCACHANTAPATQIKCCACHETDLIPFETSPLAQRCELWVHPPFEDVTSYSKIPNSRIPSFLGAKCIVPI